MASWDKLEGESAKAFKAFCVYRDMEDRSMRKSLEVIGKPPGYIRQLERWSAAFGWVRRAEAYDVFQEAEKRRTMEKDRTKMNERHVKQSQAIQNKVVERLMTIKPSELSPSDLIKWFEVAAKTERLARGETTENIKQESTGKGGDPFGLEGLDFTRLSVEELKTLAELIKRARVTEPGGDTAQN